MKPKTMILMGLAIVCGLGASYMTSRLLAERQPVEEEKVKILVAKRIVSVGEKITKPEELFEVKEVSKDSEPPDAIKEFDQLKGKTMKQSRNKGDHVSAANLMEHGGLDIPEGHQAAGIRVNLETSAHGLATLPGSRVNLILTLRGQNIADTRVIRLLENVLVLAADTRVTREGEIAAPSQVVTFALKPEDVLRVSGAESLGAIKLALRKRDDDTSDDRREINFNEIIGTTKIKDNSATRSVSAPEVKPVTPPPVAKVEPKVDVTPVPEGPKGERRTTVIHNGKEAVVVEYWVMPDGTYRFAHDEHAAPAPRVQPRPQQNPQPQQATPSKERDL